MNPWIWNIGQIVFLAVQLWFVFWDLPISLGCGAASLFFGVLAIRGHRRREKMVADEWLAGMRRL